MDSRGNPTVEAEVWLETGIMARASVPSGASTGIHEAHELRDGGHEYGGKSVLKAVNNVQNVIGPVLLGMNADQQSEIDQRMIELDGTEQKTKLGANAILAVSLACAKAVASSQNISLYKYISQLGSSPVSLPMPMMNILNGGQHAQNSTDIQENMIIPVGAADMAMAVRMGAEIFHSLKDILLQEKLSATVGDEGGFAPALPNNLSAISLITKAVTKAGYQSGIDVAFAVDVAASELYLDGKYKFKSEARNFNSRQLIDWYRDKLVPAGVVSIEDGLAQDDWPGWSQLTEAIPSVQIVGDDLLVTNIKRLERAITQKAANAILIKPNQIGTLTETINTIKRAQAASIKTIVSHRSGETEDVSIVHLAVGMNCGQIKTGSLSRGERIAKYNELLRLAEDRDLKLSNPFQKI